MEVLIRNPPVSASPPFPVPTRLRRSLGAVNSPCNLLVAERKMTTFVQIWSSSIGVSRRFRCNLETPCRSDGSVPEENVEEHAGLSSKEKEMREDPPCLGCESKGVVSCPTCSGSGLYVDAVLESQGVIVQVRCLGCGGTGNIMCSECGGRGHA